MAAPKKSVQCVYIPTEPSRPIEEWTIEYTEENEVGCLIEHLKIHYNKIIKADNAQEIRNEGVLNELQKTGQKVDTSIVDAFSAMTFIGNISLLTGRNTPEDGVHVNMYLDDNGSANGYQNNVRAQQIVNTVGANHVGPVWGDAFIASFYDDNDKFERRNFIKADLNSSSEWFQEAKRRNNKNKGNTNENLKKLQAHLKNSDVLGKNASQYKIGDSVIVNGLKSKPHYNGKVGTIKGVYIGEKDRWPVLLFDGAILSVKTDNLTNNLAELQGTNESEL